MRLIQTTVVAALTAAGIALAAAPAANAQDVAFTHYRHGPAQMPFDQPIGPMMGGGGGGELLAIACSERGATHLEAALEAAAERLELTAAQTPLFEDFRTAALAAQTGFADACVAAREARPDDLVDAIRLRQSLVSAHLEAVDSALPAFEAFYDSLTDRQKLDLVQMRQGARHNWQGDDGPRFMFRR